MFEDFSFSSPSSRPERLAVDAEDRLMVDCNSPLISPLSSRCPSPRRLRTLSRPRSSYFRSQQPPTSVPFSYEQNRLSISTLTQKLHEHTIQGPNGERIPDQGRLAYEGAKTPTRYPGYVLTPPDTDHDEDGHFESSPSLCSNPSPTSAPPEFPALDGLPDPNPQGLPDHGNVRQQRQQISQLQCNEGDIDAIRRNVYSDDSQFPETVLEDDCHPSSLPPRASPRRRATTLHRSRFGPSDSSAAESRGRRRSSSGTMQSHRIEKSHHGFGGRDASKRSELGLRRKSMVSAALASVVERP
ncbi:hypothetical protein N7532_012003 [Penicillium argentinense]|uniref:Uncharacterized protein n=1 Tax=Penicillium argentinense TaxID=1131581 RepID=A0A9W9EJM5_9EURO|nr:uncharacterized protein N7532_012003 [Penicillium argentinense]KAJ5082960.1 hypothetical protein N7532_012003 [Penicillium argentinense]